jgi:hypothetical protein
MTPSPSVSAPAVTWPHGHREDPLPKWGCVRASHARPAARRPLTRVSPTRRPPSSWRSCTRRSSPMSCASCCACGAGSTASCPACAACRAPPGQTRPAAWATRPSRGSWCTACACAVAAASAPCPRCELEQGAAGGPGSSAAQLGGRRGRRPCVLTGRRASGLRTGRGWSCQSPRVGPVPQITPGTARAWQLSCGQPADAPHVHVAGHCVRQACEPGHHTAQGEAELEERGRGAGRPALRQPAPVE